MKNKPSLVNKCKEVGIFLLDKSPEILMCFIALAFISAPITISYALESQVQPNISISEPIIIIQDPKKPHISLNKSVLKFSPKDDQN